MTLSKPQHLFSTLLIACAALFIGEALYLVFAESQVRLWMVFVHLGVGAPLAVVGALLATLAITHWRGHLGDSWPSERVTAWMLTAAISGAGWVGASTLFTMSLSGRIATEWMAALATALGAAISLVIFVAASGVIATYVERLLGICATRPILAQLARPRTWLMAAGLGFVAAIALGFMVAADTLSVLPWAYVVGPVVAVIAGVAAHFLLGRSSLDAAPLRRYLVAGLIALGLFSFFLPGPLDGARQSFVDRPALASLWKSTLHPYLDFDGDGSLFFYGGGDCAPFDPDRGPNQREIPNDGIDQNCSGFDLVVDLDEFHSGPKHVERPDGIADKPHVILITTDALSFPHTTVGGYERDVTPNLAQWADRATVFETAFSNSTSTRLAMPGLLASKMNSQMHLKDGRVHPYDYHDDEETLAVFLSRKGYRTVHIPGTSYFADRWDGYWNGFDEVDTETFRNAADEHHTSPELTDAAIEVIENHDDGPLHLWIHYYDHHGPYIIPEGGKIFGDGESNNDRFDSELHFADQSWKRLLATIEDTWEPDEYIIVFTSDHGEAFDDNHPRQHHDFSVYTRPLHIPLIIQAPWGRGQRIEGLTGHIDVVPTMTNLIGTEPREDWLGESLVPALVDGTSPEKSVIYSLFYIPEAAKRGEHRFQMIGVRTDEWYYFENRRRGERRLVR